MIQSPEPKDFSKLVPYRPDKAAYAHDLDSLSTRREAYDVARLVSLPQTFCIAGFL